MVSSNFTPGMRQYWDVKNKFPDCLVLFRMGDFYETFYDDAKIVSRELQIVLTSRGKGDKKAPLAGIPYRALDTYLSKLIVKGYKVAICEQLEDPKKAKGLVKRGVVRVVTPGTLFESNFLSKNNNYILSIVGPSKEKGDNHVYGIGISDFSTGELYATELDSLNDVDTEIERFSPRELLLPDDKSNGDGLREKLRKKLIDEYGIKPTYIESYKFDVENAKYLIKKHLNVDNPAAFGIGDKPLALSAIGGLLSYMEYTLLGKPIKHLNKISYYSPGNDMIVDAITQRNLDLVKNQIDGSKHGTLLSVIDETITPMGSRMIRKWVLSPIKNINKIEERLDCVESLVGDPILLDKIRESMKGFYDLERIATRISLSTASPRDLIALRDSLVNFKSLIKILTITMQKRSQKDLSDTLSRKYRLPRRLLGPENIDTKILDKIERIIDEGINDDPPSFVRDGNVIKSGYSKELDELREVIHNTKSWLSKLEQEERQKLGLSKLKVGYNKIIGYYIEISKSQLSKIKIPDYYIRRQTQLNSERFITPELKEKEAMVFNAEERIKSVEYNLFMKILDEISEYSDVIKRLSLWLGEFDTYQSLSYVSRLYGYTRPVITEENIIDIYKGRHPVVERMVDAFIPNDIHLNNKELVAIVTGPNMAGKSTILRQIALITLMAHMGSFVPAEKAIIGITDRIFTRVGARDDITRGQSTFMMEMVETANILNNATERSLVILDEIGRGTSTYDGMALAWAISEYLSTKIRCKTMFATHYHLLNLLSLKYDNIVNYNVAVEDSGADVVFLHKLVRGGTDKSYGIHVAKLAGIPRDVIIRSMEIANILEQNDNVHKEALNQIPLTLLEREDKELKQNFNIKLETRDPEEEKKKKYSGQTTLFMFDD
ncbi:DNA mismatch repair protein MutS [Candidatus Micrarchaeota archaeon]|nr:DNA mismatch repair protein MutS [Candidatus Micrarchaeota archaeon]